MPDPVTGISGSAEIVLAKLRGMIAGGRQPTDAILGTIAVSAHALTSANGAAIAMPQAGQVVCVGRSGDIAPELGARLNVDSGISGECLRTGRIMRCDDAARDFYADPEVCRKLNLQSIAAVPLRGRRGRVGLLEVFSTQSYAFTEEHMELLGRLAGLAEATWAQGPAAEEGWAGQDQPVEGPPAGPIQTGEFQERKTFTGDSDAAVTLAASPAPDLPVLDLPVPNLPEEIPAERTRRNRMIAAMCATLLVLLMVLGWKTWYKSSLPGNSSRTTGRLQDGQPDGPDAALEVGPDLAPAGEGSQPPRARVPGVAMPRTKALAVAVQPPDTVIRREPRAAQAPDRSSADTTPDSTAGAADLPLIPMSGDRAPELQSLLPASPALPKLNGPISHGVTGGGLVRKVLPVYPAAARQSHIEGTVVLEGTVSEHGQIEDLKVVSGPPVLAEAAMDAVRKWRYTPYLLNGTPVRKQTRINISFVSPP
jgi:TonB family protein